MGRLHSSMSVTLCCEQKFNGSKWLLHIRLSVVYVESLCLSLYLEDLQYCLLMLSDVQVVLLA